MKTLALLTRDEIAAIIRTASEGDLVAAYTANHFFLPFGVPSMGKN